MTKHITAKDVFWIVVLGGLWLGFVWAALHTRVVNATHLPSTELKVNAVEGKKVTVQPFLSPQFVLLAEGNVPDKFESMTCIPRPKELGAVNGTKFIGTELDCGDKGKFLVTEVDFLH